MARTTLAVQRCVVGGVAPTLSAANADGHSFANDGNTMLLIENAAAETTVTLVASGSEGGVDLEDVVLTIPATGAGGQLIAGPFAPRVFNQTSGVVNVNFALATDITIAAIQVKPY